MVATILIVLLLAIAQFGVTWSNYVSVTQAAREGARRAVVKGSEGQAAMIAYGESGARESAPELDQTQLIVQVSAPAGTWAAGDPIKVTTRYPYKISLLGFIPLKQGELVAATTMRRE